MNPLLIIMVLLGCSQLIAGPVLVYFRNRQQAYPTFHKFDPHEPPMQLSEDYFEYIDKLKQLGFTLDAHLYQEGQTEGVNSCVTLFTNQKELTAAVVVSMLAKNVTPNNYVEFCTQFIDGSELNSNNCAIPDVFTKMPEKLIYSVPHVKKVSELFCVHQKLLNTKSKVFGRKLPFPGQEVSALCDGMARDFEKQESYGNLQLDADKKVYRPTIKGSVLMTWKIAWPIGAIRKQLQYLRGKQLVRKLGLE